MNFTHMDFAKLLGIAINLVKLCRQYPSLLYFILGVAILLVIHFHNLDSYLTYPWFQNLWQLVWQLEWQLVWQRAWQLGWPLVLLLVAAGLVIYPLIIWAKIASRTLRKGSFNKGAKKILILLGLIFDILFIGLAIWEVFRSSIGVNRYIYA